MASTFAVRMYFDFPENVALIGVLSYKTRQFFPTLYHVWPKSRTKYVNFSRLCTIFGINHVQNPSIFPENVVLNGKICNKMRRYANKKVQTKTDLHPYAFPIDLINQSNHINGLKLFLGF